MNNAYEQLRAEGYLRSRGGSGFFVSEQLPQFDTTLEKAKTKPVHQWPPLSGYGQHLLDITGGKVLGDGDKNDNLPFTVGVPDLHAFPVKIWQQLIRRHSDRQLLMGYHSNQGYFPLRHALADYLNVSRGLNCKPGQIVITQGAQQGLALCAQLLIDPGDAALVEEPGYAGAKSAFSSAGAALEAVMLGDNGININAPRHRWVSSPLLHANPSVPLRWDSTCQ